MKFMNATVLSAGFPRPRVVVTCDDPDRSVPSVTYVFDNANRFAMSWPPAPRLRFLDVDPGTDTGRMLLDVFGLAGAVPGGLVRTNGSIAVDDDRVIVDELGRLAVIGTLSSVDYPGNDEFWAVEDAMSRVNLQLLTGAEGLVTDETRGTIDGLLRGWDDPRDGDLRKLVVDWMSLSECVERSLEMSRGGAGAGGVDLAHGAPLSIVYAIGNLHQEHTGDEAAQRTTLGGRGNTLLRLNPDFRASLGQEGSNTLVFRLEGVAERHTSEAILLRVYLLPAQGWAATPDDESIEPIGLAPLHFDMDGSAEARFPGALNPGKIHLVELCAGRFLPPDPAATIRVAIDEAQARLALTGLGQPGPAADIIDSLKAALLATCSTEDEAQRQLNQILERARTLSTSGDVFPVTEHSRYTRPDGKK